MIRPLLLALAATALLASPAPAGPPNVVLILADDLGFSDLGCYGGEVATPNLDALAANGLRFTRFYNAARCCPTRASLLTGLYPHQAGVGGMTVDRGVPGYRGTLGPNTVTIAEVLRAAGYRTLMSGKWHLSPGSGRRQTPIDRGFDEYYGLVEGFRDFWDPGAYVRLPAGRPARTYPPGGFYATDAFTDHALDFLADARREPGRPFFLYLAYTAPHFPLHARPGDVGKYKGTYAKGWDKVREERYARQVKLGLTDPKWPLPPRSGFETRGDFHRTGENPAWDSLPADRKADLARRMAVYAAMADRMDWNIGRVVADLRGHGQLDDTLILFLSDNGACAEWDPFGFDGASGPRNVLHAGPALDAMGGPGDLPQLRVRLGERLQHPVPVVQALLPRGGDQHPADRPLAEGHPGPGRAAPAAGSRDRRHGHLPRPGRRDLPRREGR